MVHSLLLRRSLAASLGTRLNYTVAANACLTCGFDWDRSNILACKDMYMYNTRYMETW
jgi:hypothetical protein